MYVACRPASQPYLRRSPWRQEARREGAANNCILAKQLSVIPLPISHKLSAPSPGDDRLLVSAICLRGESVSGDLILEMYLGCDLLCGNATLVIAMP